MRNLGKVWLDLVSLFLCTRWETAWCRADMYEIHYKINLFFMCWIFFFLKYPMYRLMLGYRCWYLDSHSNVQFYWSFSGLGIRSLKNLFFAPQKSKKRAKKDRMSDLLFFCSFTLFSRAKERFALRTLFVKERFAHLEKTCIFKRIFLAVFVRFQIDVYYL